MRQFVRNLTLCSTIAVVCWSESTVQISDDQGYSAVVSTNRAVQGNALVRDSTVTGAQGRTYKRQGIRRYNRESGQLENSTTATTARGRTFQGQRSLQKNPDGSISRSVNYTGAKGNTVSGESTSVKTENGWVANGTYTGRQGQSGTWQSQQTRSSQGMGFDRKTTVNSSTGKTAEKSVSVRKNNGAVEKTTTRANGQKRQTRATGSRK